MTSAPRGRADTIRLRFELLETRNSQALLAYLAFPAGRFHSREKITALLWGDTPEAQARQSFRQALARIRRAVGDGLPVVLTRGDTLALNPDIVAADVAELESALADHSLVGRLRAATLYKGHFVRNSVHVSTKKSSGHEAPTETDAYQDAAARRLLWSGRGHSALAQPSTADSGSACVSARFVN